MHRKVFATLCATLMLAAGLTAASAFGGKDGGDGDKHALKGVAITEKGKLIAFKTDDPWKSYKVGRIKGLDGDDDLVDIDYRPATGDLYGLGNNGGVYVVDDRNGRATLQSRLNVALAGTSFGVDFNPVVDRLRIISDTGQNLRDNVDANGDTLVDGTLTYPGPPPATALGVTGAAYTNNDADPNTATTLFDIDSVMDQTVIQAPANSGMLSATGKLGVDTDATIGFDIYSSIEEDTTADNTGFASLTVEGKSALYEISLLTGSADAVGWFWKRHHVTGIAIPPNQH